MGILPKETTHKIARLLLRTIPLIPGPEIYDIFVDVRKGDKSINEKIDKAYESLKDTSQLIDGLEKELIERTDKVKELKTKYEEYAKLAEIEEDKIQPLLTQLEKTMGKGKLAERIISFLINIIAGVLLFIAGIWLGPKIQNMLKQPNVDQQELPINNTIDTLEKDEIKNDTL
jgi:hypothetical protein